MKRTGILLIFGLIAILGLSGCASWLGFDDEPRDPGFYQQATPNRNGVPLPVQIAQDIEKITEDGALILKGDPLSMGVSETAAKTLTREQRQAQDFEYNNITSARQDQKDRDDEDDDDDVDMDQVAQEQNAVPISEDDLVLKEDKGPLVQANIRKKTGPLNFRRKLSSTLPPLKGGKTVSYVVKLGDTLMKIAFEKYANYLRWKDIYKINKKKIGHPRRMKVGTELTIRNVKYVYIKRDGRPYLIRKNDTLKSISKQLYGTASRWKEIYKNNPQLIRNPKKIYHGFTLYYQPDKKSNVPVRQPSKVKDEASK